MSKLVGFPASLGYLFRISGRWHRLNGSGITTLQLLGKIHEGIPATPNAYWLLRFHAEIQAIHRLNAKAVLSYVVDQTSNRNVRVLAIWLRGRSGGHVGTEILAKYTTCADYTIRKEVVRSLIRMNAWSRLSEIAQHDVNTRIRRLARSRAPIEYETRLSNFARHVARNPSERRNQSLYVSPNLDDTEPTPPKSVLFIREILERIRDLVHGWQREP